MVRTQAVKMEWRFTGMCAGADPEIFFPAREIEPFIDEAMRLCGMCPVRVQCGQWAIEKGIEYGIWGGMTTDARRAHHVAIPPEQRQRRRGDRDCGSEKGYHWHVRHDERPCDACREARNAECTRRKQESRARRAAAKTAQGTGDTENLRRVS